MQAEQWSLARPERFNFAIDVVDRWAEAHPDSEAMYWVSQDLSHRRSMTYQYFSHQSRRVAALFDQLGAKQKDVAIVILPRIPAWWEIALASIRTGVILAPVPTLVTEKDIQYRCNKSKARVFIGDTTSVRKFLAVRSHCPSVEIVIKVSGSSTDGTVSYHEAVEAIAEDVTFKAISLPWDHPALIYFTSGTSGLPKMVVHNQISFPLALSNTGKYWLQLEPGKLFWNTADQGWAKASYSFFGAWNCGASLFVFDDRKPFNANRLLDVLHRFPITTLCAPPLAWRQLALQEARDFYALYPPKALTHCTSAGEALNDGVIRQWKKSSGLDIYDGYGQTESILLCGNFKDFPVRQGSMGKPAPSVPLAIIDAHGKECSAGEEGNMAVRLTRLGEPGRFFGIFDGYVNEDGILSRKEQNFNVNGTIETWYLTGDKARRDEDGYFWFVGRADDVINSSGYRIGPFEVESTLKQHSAVVESAVISSPDPQRGEIVKAFVVLTSDYANKSPPQLASLAKELQSFCKANAAPYKYPRRIQFVEADFMPKTVSGKIQRNLLRKMEWKDYKPKL